MPILIPTEPTSVTYNTLDAEIPAKSSTLNSEDPKVELCVLESINGDPFKASSGSAPDLDLLIPMAFVIVYVFGWCLFLIAAPEEHPSPAAQQGMAWTGLVLSILAAAGLAYFAVYVAHIQFSEIDWESSSFDEPCVHRTNLPRKQCPLRECCQLHRFNNLKFFLTMCVAITHFWGVLRPASVCSTGKDLDPLFSQVIYVSWHEQFTMNTYSFISGILSTPIGGSPQDFRRMDGTVSRVVFLYLFSQVFFLIFLWNVSRILGGSDIYDPDKGRTLVSGGTSKPVSFLNWVMAPYMHLWYLQALVIWRVSAPYWCRLKYPLFYAVLLGLLSGYMGNGPVGNSSLTATPSSIRKIWGYFPFYMLGVMMQRNKYLLMDVLNSRKLQMLGAVSCVVSFFLTSYVSCGDIEHWDQTCKKRYTNFWIYRDPYEVSQSQSEVILVKEDGWWAVAQLGLYLFSTMMMFGIMSLVPNKRIPILTDFGSRSLTNYIYHLAFMFLLGYTGLFKHPNQSWRQPVVVLMAVLTSLLLMTPWASFAVSWLINPPLGRLGMLSSSVKEHVEKEEEREYIGAQHVATHAEERTIAQTYLKRVYKWVLKHKTVVPLACGLVLLTLAMTALKNPWKPYWEDKALLANNPYTNPHASKLYHLCPEWAQYNMTELETFLEHG